jgi:hypothetical protein
METARSSEILIPVYQMAWYHTPGDHILTFVTLRTSNLIQEADKYEEDKEGDGEEYR